MARLMIEVRGGTIEAVLCDDRDLVEAIPIEVVIRDFDDIDDGLDDPMDYENPEDWVTLY